MGNILTGDQAKVAFRKLGEVARQLGQDGGYPHDPERLLRALQALTEGRFEAVATSCPSQVHCPELIPEGWSIAIIDGVPQDVGPSNFDVSKLQPRSFVFVKDRDKKRYIDGPEMRKRALEFKANLGLCDGKRLLAEQDKIPVEFRGFYIPLPGTLLRGSVGGLYVPCLRWDGGHWVLDFNWLDGGWDGRDRLACSE